tara:strand:+ start:7762 stop:8811 length:1050 start_codon:yes stop_codon:yes gene_type:complete
MSNLVDIAGINISEKGQPNGIATLDPNAKVPAIELNIATDQNIIDKTAGALIDAARVAPDNIININSDVTLPTVNAVKGIVNNAIASVYKAEGSWDASLNLFPANTKAGYIYIVSTIGVVSGVSFHVGDHLLSIIDNASTTVYAGNWNKIDNNDDVVSVFGRKGVITAQNNDYTAAQVANASFGNLNTTDLQSTINELVARTTPSYLSAIKGVPSILSINDYIVWGASAQIESRGFDLSTLPLGYIKCKIGVIHKISCSLRYQDPINPSYAVFQFCDFDNGNTIAYKPEIILESSNGGTANGAMPTATFISDFSGFSKPDGHVKVGVKYGTGNSGALNWSSHIVVETFA